MSIYTEVIQKDWRYHAMDAVRDLSLLEPGFRQNAIAFLADLRAAGHDARVTETYRSRERQAHLFDQGYTQLPPPRDLRDCQARSVTLFLQRDAK